MAIKQESELIYCGNELRRCGHNLSKIRGHVSKSYFYWSNDLECRPFKNSFYVLPFIHVRARICSLLMITGTYCIKAIRVCVGTAVPISALLLDFCKLKLELNEKNE